MRWSGTRDISRILRIDPFFLYSYTVYLYYTFSHEDAVLCALTMLSVSLYYSPFVNLCVFVHV